MATLSINSSIYLSTTDRRADPPNALPPASDGRMQPETSPQVAALNDQLNEMQANTAALQSVVQLRSAVSNLRSSIGNSLLTLVGFGRSTPLTPTQRLPLMTQVVQAKGRASDLLNHVTSNDPAAKAAIATAARVGLERVTLEALSSAARTSTGQNPFTGEIVEPTFPEHEYAVQQLLQLQIGQALGTAALSFEHQTQPTLPHLFYG